MTPEWHSPDLIPAVKNATLLAWLVGFGLLAIATFLFRR